MRILGIDTATAYASVALVDDNRLIAQRCFPEKNEAVSRIKSNHAEVIIGLIDQVLREAGLSCGNLDRVAVSIGPGSFTGVRIGLGTAKGIAFGCAVPVVGISTLMAYATAIDRFELLCPLLDARKKEAYMALFRYRAGNIHRLTEDLVLPISEVVRRIGQHSAVGTCAVIGAAAKIYSDVLREALGERVVFVEEPEAFSVAAAVARLAVVAPADSGGVGHLAELLPAYVRSAEAESKRQGSPNPSN